MAEIQGLSDVYDAWEKFVGHHVGRGTLSCDFIAGEWRKWIPTARAIQRADRDKQKTKVPYPVQGKGANGERLWKVGGGGGA